MSIMNGMLPGLYDVRSHHTFPYLVSCLIVLITCIATRIITSQRSTLNFNYTNGSKTPGVVPHSVPWLGSAISFGIRFQDFLADCQKLTTDTVFAVVLGGTKHNIVTSPSCTKQIFNQRSGALSNTEFTYYILGKFFGDRGSVRKMDPTVVFGDIAKQLHGLMREPFLSNAVTITVRGVEERTPNLISFAESWVDQSIWERAADVELVAGSAVPTVEASLFPLIKNFVGDLACEVLMGRDFMQNNPTILEDLWTWDGKFNLYLLGLPAWLPGMAQASQARERVRRAVQEFQEALYAVQDGKDPGSGWNDMSDVSQVMVNRATEWRKANGTAVARSAGDAAILWAMNVNANQVIFWLLWHIYSTPTLLTSIRDEIAPHVKIVPPPPDSEFSSLPISEPDTLSISLPALLKSCPLLKASYFETLRLDVHATTYKSVTEDFTVTESAEDAAIAAGLGGSKDGPSSEAKPQTYRLRKGEYVCVPHNVHQKDARYFPDPKVFDPRRFFVYHNDNDDKGEKDTEKERTEVTVEMRTIQPFGGGASMCKGRQFAEREILAFAAAILVTWDIQTVDGKWPHPGAKMASGTVSPRKDVRVLMRRRGRA